MTIRTRNDLIKFIEDSRLCDIYPRIRRAIIEGTTENLGNFHRIPCTPGNTLNGLIVIVKGKRGGWIVAIKPAVFEGYNCYILKEIPWKYWDGDDRENALFRGDDQKKYKELRNAKK